MSGKFTVIVITSPSEIEDEAAKISRLLDAGVDFVHIRKPDWSLREVRDLIEQIDYPKRKKLRLHGHFELLNEMNLAGVHLNSRNPKAPPTTRSVTKSCHSLDEISLAEGYDYVTLSPIYDSISKAGYKAKFDIDSLRPVIAGRKVIALGGVTPEKFGELAEKGFSGASLLGYIWNGDFDTSLLRIKEAVSKL